MAFLKTRFGTFYDQEILKYPVGLEATKNVVIDSTQVQMDPTSGRYVLNSGVLLISSAGAPGASELDTVSVTGTATGSFNLIVAPPQGGAGGAQPATIQLANISAQTIQNALAALPDVGYGDVTVTAGTPASGVTVYTIAFGNLLANEKVGLTIDPTNVVGTAPVLSQTTAGLVSTGTGKVKPVYNGTTGITSGQIVGILTHMVEFFYPVEPDVTDEPAAAYFHQCVFDTSKLSGVAGNLVAVQQALPTCIFS